MSDGLGALAIFLLTLFLVLFRPFGMGIGWSAILGALLCMGFGFISSEDVLYISSVVWDATLAFVLLVFISIVLDRAGLFEWGSLWAIRLSRGKGYLLFINLMLLGALTTAFFANDGAILMLTPLVYSKMKHLRLPPSTLVAYAMSAGFIADATSLPLVISNLTNIITAQFFNIGFWSYALYMLLPNITSFILSVSLLYMLYRRELIKGYEPEVLDSLPPRLAVRDPLVFKGGFLSLVFMALIFVLLELLNFQVPISSVLALVALFLILLSQRHRMISLREVLLFTPWQVLLFSVGMYAVVYSFKKVGYTEMLSSLIAELSKWGELHAILGVGFLSALLSAVMNNLPTVMFVNIAIADAKLGDGLTQFLALANVVGTNIGPKLTPIGSLATLLWLHLLEHKGTKIGWLYYTKVGFLLTFPVLFGTLFSLWLTYALTT